MDDFGVCCRSGKDSVVDDVGLFEKQAAGTRRCLCAPGFALEQSETLQELETLQRKKAALSLELTGLEEASRNRKHGTRGAGAISVDTKVEVSRSQQLRLGLHVLVESSEMPAPRESSKHRQLNDAYAKKGATLAQEAPQSTYILSAEPGHW